jgi:hypothetical protein
VPKRFDFRFSFELMVDLLILRYKPSPQVVVLNPDNPLNGSLTICSFILCLDVLVFLALLRQFKSFVVKVVVDYVDFVFPLKRQLGHSQHDFKGLELGKN